MPTDTPRVNLWKVTQDTLHRIIRLVDGIKPWDSQTLYLACQLTTTAMITAHLEHEDGVVNFGNILPLRVVMDCVANALTGCNEPTYAENELKTATIPRADRRAKSQEQRDMLKKYAPSTWKTDAEGDLGAILQNRGHSLIHGDADASFYLRSDGLHARELVGLSFCIVILLTGIRPYLTKLRAYFTDAEFNEIISRIKAALQLIATANERASYNEPFNQFELRVYEDLFKRGVNLNLSEPLRNS